MRFSILVPWLVISAVAVPGLAQEEAPDAPFQFVCPRESAPAFLDGIPVPADRAWEQLDDLPRGGTEPGGCWAWSSSCPPRLLEPGQNAAAGCRADAASSRPLTVRVLVPEASSSNGEPAVGTAAAAGFEVVAAPVAMWREVPRDLLPSTTVESGSLSLLRSDETWRVQGLAGGLASTWREVKPEDSSVELALHEAVEFTVQATAAGAPLAGARMYLVRPGLGVYSVSEPLGFGISDAEGKVSLTLSERERSAVLVSHVAWNASVFERFDETPAVVELGPGLNLTGRTVDPEGMPVTGVRLLGLSWVADELAVMQRHLGLSGPDGRFLLTGFAKGAASLQTDGGDLEYSQAFDLEGPMDLGSIVLTAPEHYWIQVVDASHGTPVPEARALFEGGEATTTDRDGLARVSPRFGRILLVNAKGYRTARFRFAGGGAAAETNPPPGLAARHVDVTGDAGAAAETPVVLRLAPAFTVEGVFVAADGVTPAASGRLVASQSVAGGSRTSNGALGGDGSFSLDLEPGAYTLELTAGNTGRRVLEVSGSAGETRDLGIIVAPASAWVSGTVVSPEYAPVPGARISYLRPTEFGALMARMMGRVAEVTANADGYFEMHGLELGPSSLRVEAEGFAPLEFEVEAAAIQWVDAGFVELSRGRRITVRSDVEGGVVNLDPGAEQDPLGPMTGKVVDGEARFENVPEEESLRVRVLDEGVPVCERREEAGTGDEVIRCDRSTVTVTGLVTAAGQPGDGRLIWHSRQENPHPEGVFHTLGGSIRRTRVATSKLELMASVDHEGRYRIESMLPGDWYVSWYPLEGGGQERREVTVPDAPDEEVVLDFRYGGVSIEGIVVDSDGQPVAHAAVDVFPRRGAVVAGENGRFQVMELPPGVYQLRARYRHQRSDLTDVELRDYDDRQSLQLELLDNPRNDELVIRLTGGGGGFCFVEMEASPQQVTRVDNGVATIELPPPLTERARVACQVDGRWVLTGWQPLEPILERGIELDPFESESSIILSGEPSTAVQVTGPGGWDLGSLRIWFGGATVFEVGETISNLPEGEYTLRWGNQLRTVWTERRRAAEVEIE